MSDEIYINTKNAPHSQLGVRSVRTFQQPYQGQQVIQGDLQALYIADGQTPFTYQTRYPFTYRGQDQGRYPFQLTGRQPNTYQHRVDIRLPFLR